jgi:hypothetical protein
VVVIMIPIVVVISIVVAIVHQVMRGDIVSAPEAFAIRLALLARKMRMTKLVAVIHVKPAVIAEVLPRAFNSVAETLVLDLRQILRRHIPAAAILG